MDTVIFRNVALPFYEEAYEVSTNGEVRSIGRYVNNRGTEEWREGRILKGSKNKYRRGEIQVKLSYKGKTQIAKVHRLVALTFPDICGNYFEGAEVDHKNGNASDNRAVNLHWVTRSGNMRNPVTRKKIKDFWESEEGSDAKKKYSERMSGENNPAVRCMTEEWRNKMSESRKGRRHTEETKRKLSEAAKGRYIGAKSARSKKCGYVNKNGIMIQFGSYREAERETGTSRGCITHSIKNNTKDHNGIQWISV